MNTSQPHNYFLAVDQAPIPFFCGYQKLKNWFQPSEAEIEKNHRCGLPVYQWEVVIKRSRGYFG